MTPVLVARFLVTAFFAVVFVQSSLDKLTNSEENLDFLRSHFKDSPFPPDMVRAMFWILTGLETAAGLFCGMGVLFFSFRRPGMNLASLGITLAGLALLSLMVGQRFAKDYAGAAVVAAYFAVAILGLGMFG